MSIDACSEVEFVCGGVGFSANRYMVLGVPIDMRYKSLQRSGWVVRWIHYDIINHAMDPDQDVTNRMSVVLRCKCNLTMRVTTFANKRLFGDDNTLVAVDNNTGDVP